MTAWVLWEAGGESPGLAAQVLVIVAASHLDAVTFQICSQSFKIMPTALFAVWLLGQYLAPLQWASLPVLAVGVVFVTMNGSTPAGGGSFEGESDLVLGLAASALSGLSSAYAGDLSCCMPSTLSVFSYRTSSPSLLQLQSFT